MAKCRGQRAPLSKIDLPVYGEGEYACATFRARGQGYIVSTMGALQKAKVISVEIERGGTGLLFATSKDMKSLFAVGRDEFEIKSSIALALVDVFLIEDKKISAFEIEGEDFADCWVIVPR